MRKNFNIAISLSSITGYWALVLVTLVLTACSGGDRGSEVESLSADELVMAERIKSYLIWYANRRFSRDYGPQSDKYLPRDQIDLRFLKSAMALDKTKIDRGNLGNTFIFQFVRAPMRRNSIEVLSHTPFDLNRITNPDLKEEDFYPVAPFAKLPSLEGLTGEAKLNATIRLPRLNYALVEAARLWLRKPERLKWVCENTVSEVFNYYFQDSPEVSSRFKKIFKRMTQVYKQEILTPELYALVEGGEYEVLYMPVTPDPDGPNKISYLGKELSTSNSIDHIDPKLVVDIIDAELAGTKVAIIKFASSVTGEPTLPGHLTTLWDSGYSNLNSAYHDKDYGFGFMIDSVRFFKRRKMEGGTPTSDAYAGCLEYLSR